MWRRLGHDIQLGQTFKTASNPDRRGDPKYNIVFKSNARVGLIHPVANTNRAHQYPPHVCSLDLAVYLAPCPRSPMSMSKVALVEGWACDSSAASSPLIVLTDRHSRTFCSTSPTRRSMAIKCGSHSTGDSWSSFMDSLMCSLSFLTLWNLKTTTTHIIWVYVAYDRYTETVDLFLHF